MQVRIGVTNIPREIEVELPEDADPTTVKQSVEQMLSNGAGMLWLTDRKGHQLGVVVEKIAYIDLGTGADKSRIGFGAL